VAVVCGHPDERDLDFDPLNPCKYVIESPGFRDRFTASVSESSLYRIIQGYCAWRRGGPLGEEETVLVDENGDGHLFHFETHFNRYKQGGPQRGAALTLGVYLRPYSARVVVSG
jgi:hypothetical protein